MARLTAPSKNAAQKKWLRRLRVLWELGTTSCWVARVQLITELNNPMTDLRSFVYFILCMLFSLTHVEERNIALNPFPQFAKQKPVERSCDQRFSDNRIEQD